jgi:hypothetical protein
MTAANLPRAGTDTNGYGLKKVGVTAVLIVSALFQFPPERSGNDVGNNIDRLLKIGLLQILGECYWNGL